MHASVESPQFHPLTPPSEHDDDHPHEPHQERSRAPPPPPTSEFYGPPQGALASSYVGKYTLYSTIGEGAFGKVKIAVHKQNNARVAIKIMDKSEIRQQDFTTQVRREIYIMRYLRHKNIVRMHEVLTSDTKLYIVMELVTGGELFDRIEHGRVHEDLARQYFQQLVDGVDFCHKSGVAHRDLKPENLLVDERGNIKITDFGFSSMKGRDVNAGLLYTQCGTPDYCAPEIIDSAKEGYNGAKVDAWSCGIILYALLCGRLPFQAQDTEELYDLILSCKVRYPDFLSSDARDLLQRLLVRDPSKRFDLASVKRHPWFLVNYDGDDARFLKKRPFFNKNQRDLSSSAPSSPVTTTPEANGTMSVSSPGRASHPSNAEVSAPVSAGSRLQQQYVPNSQTSSATYVEASDQGSSGHLPVMPVEHNGHAHHHLPPHHQQQQHAQHPESTLRHSPLAGRPMPPVPRHREDQYGMYKPPSPAGDMDSHVRSVTPPAHAVFTRVEDRPATPAKRQTSIAFKAAQAAASMHTSPLTAPHSGPHAPNGHVVSPVPHSYPRSPVEAPISPSGDTQMHIYPNPAVPNSSSYEPNAEQYCATMEGAETRGDDSSDEQDSIEDYEEKPALRLELPSESLSRLRTANDSRRASLQQSVIQTRQRHRSDLGITMSSGLAGPHPIDNGPASMSSLQLQRRGFARDGPNGSLSLDPRALRIARPSEVPSSPPVVYSPSGASGTSYDRYRSISPGYNGKPGMLSEGSSPSGAFIAGGISGFPTQWNANGNGSLSSREDGGPPSGGSFQAHVFSQHLWGMVNKLRGSTAPATDKQVISDLRHGMKLLMFEMSQLQNPAEDAAAIFMHFLHLFETQALPDSHGASPGPGRSHNRSRGTSDMDDEYEDGTTIESREEMSSTGDTRAGMPRRAATDMSSEEESLSWGPVLPDSGRHQSDLARRRNISDLLNRFLKKTNAAAAAPLLDRNDRNGYGGDEEEPPSTTELKELQRLLREHHGGREESNIADEVLRIWDKEAIDDGSSTPFGTGVQVAPGQSPPPPDVHSGRPDSYPGGRYQGGLGLNRPATPLRSVSGSNVPLPSEYVPGRFQEPNSMPNPRGYNSGHRPNGLSVRNDLDEGGNTLGPSHRSENMAGSMGMHDIAYYDSDRRNGMAMRLRGVLQTMKTKNQKLGERHAQFRTSLPAEAVMQILGRIMRDMGAEVRINRETKRKMKCSIAIHSNQILHAGIEFTTTEDGLTVVQFRRSRLDKGRTDTDSFHSFFEKVRSQFIDMANSAYPRSRRSPEQSARRRNGQATTARQISDPTGRISVS